LPFHPQVVSMLKKRKEMGARSIADFDAVEARKVSVYNRQPFARKSVKITKEDGEIGCPHGKIPVRIYTPKGRGPHPLVVFFHGGGWVVGSIEGSDEAVSLLAREANAVVVSVDYHLAPEFKFPAAPEDCLAAVEWAVAHAKELRADPSRVVVSGDSAGGNLSAAVSLMAKERGQPKIALQLLIYPLVDFTRPMGKYSKKEFGPTPKECAWFAENYFSRVPDWGNPIASPIFGELSELPPVALVTAQFDTFTEQCNEFAVKLRRSGVRVKKKEFKGMTHGFWSYPGYFDLGREAVEWSALQVRSLKGPSRAGKSR
jgi:acetyl esterase